MLVLIDGHNLIGKLPDIQLHEANDEDKLVTKLRQYQARTGRKVSVVFDTGDGYKLAQTKRSGGITIRFAPHGKTADSIIIKQLYNARNPQELMVVTSDRAIQRVAKQVRARLVSSEEFAVELNTPRMAKDNGDKPLSSDEVDEWMQLFNQSPSNEND